MQQDKLGVNQIRWISEIVLFDFNIKYLIVESKGAAGTLSHCQVISKEDSNLEANSDAYETILYITFVKKSI